MYKKGFTIIELIAAIAVLGILALLAMPKFIGYVEEAKIAHIKNDVKAHESVIDSQLTKNSKFTDDWATIPLSELNSKIDSGVVYSKRGLVEEHQGSGTYLKIPKLKDVKSRLPGLFIYQKNGGVFYIKEDIPETVTEIPITQSSCFEYEDTDENTLRITGYICDSVYVSIPETHNGTPITEIGDNAFQIFAGQVTPEEIEQMYQMLIYSVQHMYPDQEITKDNVIDLYLAYLNEQLGEEYTREQFMNEMGLSGTQSNGTVVSIEKIHFSNNIKHIGNYAFQYLETLNEVKFGNGLKTIGDEAFAWTKIVHLDLPDSLVEMGYGSFKRLYELETLNIGSGLTKISEAAFIQANSLHELTIPSTVKVVEDAAFAFNALTNLTIEEGVEIIEERGFDGEPFSSCKNTTLSDKICDKYKDKYRNSILKIPKSVTFIGENAFGGYFETVIIDDLSIMESPAFNNLVVRNMIVNGDTSNIKDYFFTGIQIIEEIRIMGDVDNMGYSAFYHLKYPDLMFDDLNLTIKDSLPNDYKGPKVVFYGDVKHISERAFEGSEIYTIEFKAGTPTSIDDFAFLGAKLENFEIPNTVVSIGESAFYNGNINKTGTIKIPDSVEIIGENAFLRYYDNLGLEKIEFGLNTNIRQIGNLAFYSENYSFKMTVKAPSSKHSMINNTYSNVILEHY